MMLSRWLPLILALITCSCKQGDVAGMLDQKRQSLSELAEYRPRGEVGAIGFRSSNYDRDDIGEWVEIEFAEPQLVDSVVLVPALRRDSKNGLQADGFPEVFEVIIQLEDREELVIELNNDELHFLPRVAPLVVDLPHPLIARSIRIKSKRLGTIGWHDRFALAFAEVMVFSGELNVALRQDVRSRTRGQRYEIARSRDLRYLVDGHLPYGMGGAGGERSVSFLASQPIGREFIWQIDLGRESEIDRFRFHRIELDDTVPRSEAGDYGVPRVIEVIGSQSKDFEDKVMLLEKTHLKTIFDKGPILNFRTHPEPVRFVRFMMKADTIESDFERDLNVIGCAEIELIADGENVAQGRPLLELNQYAKCPLSRMRMPASVTDGMNFYGGILPMREWVEQLARRHELEREIPQLETELVGLYLEQKRTVAIGSGILVIAALLSFYFAWWRPRRERREFKKRFAADIHDELGANLHTISFISDQLENEDLEYRDILKIKKKIRHVAERAGRVVYHLSGVIASSDLYRGLVDDITRASERVLGTHDHRMKVEGSELLEKVPKKLQVDILLFYQESLVNIGRHSESEKFETELIVTPSHLYLRVRDFGADCANSSQDVMSKSLLRRAKLLRGKVSVTQPEGGGVMVSLEKKW